MQYPPGGCEESPARHRHQLLGTLDTFEQTDPLQPLRYAAARLNRVVIAKQSPIRGEEILHNLQVDGIVVYHEHLTFAGTRNWHARGEGLLRTPSIYWQAPMNRDVGGKSSATPSQGLGLV